MIFNRIGLVLGLATLFFLTGCAGKKVTTPVTPRPLSKVTDQNLSPEERKVQALARQIEIENASRENKRELDKLRDPAEQKAVKIIAKEEKKAIDRQHDDARVLRNANIEGCPEGGVNVSDWATGRHSYQAYSKMRIINTSGIPVDIVDIFDGRTAVYNLCAGGSITLFRAISFVWDSNQVTYQYVATGKFPDGNIGTAQSMPVSLSQYNTSYTNGQPYIWQIQLQKFLRQR